MMAISSQQSRGAATNRWSRVEHPGITFPERRPRWLTSRRRLQVSVKWRARCRHYLAAETAYADHAACRRLDPKGALPESLDRSRDARFTAVYDAYYHRILGYAQRRSGPDDAGDIVAETFAVACRRFDDVPDGEQALYWLYATARRVLANHRRAEQRRAVLAGAIASEALMVPPA